MDIQFHDLTKAGYYYEIFKFDTNTTIYSLILFTYIYMNIVCMIRENNDIVMNKGQLG